MKTLPSYMVVRQLALGDVLLATPIIRQLFQDHDGQCHIDVLTMKPEIFLNSPYVRRVYNPQDFNQAEGPYARVINLDLAYENLPKMHVVDAYAMTSHGSPEKIKDKRLELFMSAADREKAKTIQETKICGPYVVIHMRKDTWPSRNLPDATWKGIINILLEHTDFKIIQVGSTHEIAFDHHPRLLNFLGAFSIHELREIIAGAKCYLGVDSGTLHVAACTDTPVIAMFSSAHHRLREPLERPPHARFIAIQPQVDCYGCQEHYPPPITGVICHRGDPFSPPCRDAFDIDNVRQSLVDLSLSKI